jgi:hypothetical protein
MKKIVFLVLSAFILLFIGFTTDKDLNSSSEKSTTAKLQDPVTIKPDVIVVGGGLGGLYGGFTSLRIRRKSSTF